MNAHRQPVRRVMLTTDSLGGTWTYALELAAGLSGYGIDTVIVLMGPPATRHQKEQVKRLDAVSLIDSDLPLHWTVGSSREWQGVATRLQALADAMNADVVHLHEPAAAGREPWTRPLLTTVHSCIATWWRAVRGGTVPGDLAWRIEATAEGLTVADANIVPSHSFLRDLRATYGSRFAAKVVLNGACAPAVERENDTRRVAVTTGRLWDDAKNIAALDAAAALCNVPIVAAGALTSPSGEQRTYDFLETPGILSRRALFALLGDAAAYISLARYEPFGLGVLEAAQLGLPLILSDISTHRELWDGAAVFVPCDDPRAIARAIDATVEEAVSFSQLREYARQRSRAYSRDRMVSGTLDLYRSVLSDGPAMRRVS